MTKCTHCSKPATLHITEIRDGAVQELHLCESCAQKYLSSPYPSDETADGADKLAEAMGEEDIEELEELDQLVCPNCGISFRQFRSQGRLGCPHDYIAFQRELMPLLENIHGETQHTGKCPQRAPGASRQQYQLIKLRSDLLTAVDEEDYETAARLRDEIQTLEADSEADPEAEQTETE